jgi:uncharacterized membrane protein YdbT with pleckstrin-like domain
MPDIDERLISGEEVVQRTVKHWLAPIADSKWAILLILGALVLAWIQPNATEGILGFFSRGIELVRVALFLGAVVWIAYNVIAWRTAYYSVTNRRVLCHEGLLRSRSTDTLLNALTDIRTTVPALGRVLGYGTIRIVSASGEAGADEFTTVKDVERFKKVILEQMADAAKPSARPAGQTEPVGAPAGSTAAAPPMLAAAELTATLGELAKLRDAGAITSTEFEAKKTELLARI